MNSLINSKTMSSVEIAALTGKRHDHVIRDVENTMKLLPEDSPDLGSGFKSSTYVAGNGKNEKCYELSRDATVLIMTGYSVNMRARLVKRWSELEEEAQKPLSLEEMTVQVIQAQQDKIREQQKQIKVKDDLIFVSNEASIKAGDISIREFVKTNDAIDIGGNKFIAWLREKGIIMRHSRQPLQKYVDRGWLSWKFSNKTINGNKRRELKVTPRGQLQLARMYLQFKSNRQLVTN
ncbi:MAG: phage regulatory protein/antirepressor Ant [Gammaproteobacteria bacterium]|nr:phage regulatory protein/antirepressor Ant [Gammaproteobacteria bacterium]